MSRRVAITGATGFIGKKLAMKHLSLGDTVRVLSRRLPSEGVLSKSVLWFNGDITTGTDLCAFVDDADVVYHCAGEIRDISRMKALHVDGTQRLIQAAAGRVGCWVQLSSAGVYGQQRAGVVTEETNLNPIGVYEITKLHSDTLVQAAGLDGAFQFVVLRPSNVYGAEMPNQSLYSLISMIRRGWFFFIGESGAVANYIHVDNVIEALMLCGENPAAIGQSYNLSDYRTLEDFVGSIAKLLGCAKPQTRLPEQPIRVLANLMKGIPGVPLTPGRVDALTMRAIYSNEKIERELGYGHIISMEEGLQELVGEYKQHLGLR